MTRQDYQTPPELLEAIAKRFGPISFDLCCTRENAVAPLGYHHPEVDALAEDWRTLVDESVTDLFLAYANPPFALSRHFARKAFESQQAELVPTVLLLVPASVDSRWFIDYVAPAALVLPLTPRVTFVGQPAGIDRPLMLCCYGPAFEPGFENWIWAEKQANHRRKPK